MLTCHIAPDHVRYTVGKLHIPTCRQGNSLSRVQHYSFVETDHEIFSTIILSVSLIQEGQFSVSGESMCTSTGATA